MIREALQWLADHGAPFIHSTGNGLEYSSERLHLIEPPKPATITLASLQGIVDYLNIEKKAKDSGYFLHVESPTRVTLQSPLDDGYMDRDVLVEARIFDGPRPSLFGEYHSPDKFIVWLQTGFVDTAARQELLKMVSNVRDELVNTSEDDGVTQTVSVRSGVSFVQNAKVPNPVILAPYRTFPEIEQPETTFVCRAKSGPAFALFEVAAAEWQMEAVNSIAAWLIEHQSLPVIR